MMLQHTLLLSWCHFAAAVSAGHEQVTVGVVNGAGRFRLLHARSLHAWH
jgi:hypothetical protein